MTKKRRRPIHLHVMVSEEEQALIQERMAEAGIRNMGAYMRKMALSGYVLHVDLSPVRELVSLQRRCSYNLNQVAIQANTYGAIYPEVEKAGERYQPLPGWVRALPARRAVSRDQTAAPTKRHSPAARPRVLRDKVSKSKNTVCRKEGFLRRPPTSALIKQRREKVQFKRWRIVSPMA